MIPKHLYHYTSIEGLKAIVSSRTIRFTRLDLLNDPYEGYFSINNVPDDIDNYRKYIYVSCWNSQAIDSISLWYIYTKMNGVRIKAKASMFGESMYIEELSSCLIPKSQISPISVGTKGLDKEVEVTSIYGPYKVVYDNHLEETYKHMYDTSIAGAIDKKFTMYNVFLKEFGLRKVMHWSFENEWRYKIALFSSIHGSQDVILQYHDVETPDYIDIPYYADIDEVIVAPNMTDSYLFDIKKFLSSEGLDVKIERSGIKIGL